MNAQTKPHKTFQYSRAVDIPSLNITVEEYEHIKTGAKHFHLASENDENVFLVGLRTIPMDSTGAAHILEHTALCGSEHFPVRDPFFMMLRRSLNTFMNAFTSSDWTAYPFASKNKKDFQNLLTVYLDAVFFSRLDPLDFSQEGHRMEFSTPNDPSSDLVYKGVVYNEMKGAMSSPTSILWQTLSKHLFPTTTYHYNSGGEPADIPNLSYDELVSFYKKHYHPSNAIFLTYGDIPAHSHQEQFENRVLHRFEKSNDEITVEDEKRFNKPLTVEESYPVDPETLGKKDQTHIVVSWLLTHSNNLEERLKAKLLEGVLLDNSASPLRKALETTNLGSAPSPLCGLEADNREMSFVCGVEGSTPENADKVETLILKVLNDVATNGVPQDKLEAALHQLELSQREITGNRYPYGLQLILEGLSAAIHRGDPIAVLNLDPVLEKLHQDIQRPDYFNNLVKEFLLNNNHRLRLTLRPDGMLAKQREQETADRLATYKANLSDDDKANIVATSKSLTDRQNIVEDMSILPKVTLEDIPKEKFIPTATVTTVKHSPCHYYGQGTNGLVYQQVVIDLPQIPKALLPALPFYSAFLTELGCGDHDYLTMQARVARHTGGIGAHTSISGHIHDEQIHSGYFTLSGKALNRNQDKLAQLMNETLSTIRFDEIHRIRELIAQIRGSSEEGISQSGHQYAMLVASSGMSPVAAFHEQLEGLTGIRSLIQLDQQIKSDEAPLKNLALSLQQIHELVMASPRQFVSVGEIENKTPMLESMNNAWNAPLDSPDFVPFNLDKIREPIKALWLTNTQVNFCAKAYPTVPSDHKDAAPLQVLAGFLRNGYLHRAIREQGGAYGGGAGYDPVIAAFRFYSYRDPRLTKTLDDFDQSIDWLLNTEHDYQPLEEAILGVISAIDKPSSPAGEAKSAFHNALFGRTAQQRQKERGRVLDVTIKDLKRVTQTYLVPEKASIAVVSNGLTFEKVGDCGLTVERMP